MVLVVHTVLWKPVNCRRCYAVVLSSHVLFHPQPLLPIAGHVNLIATQPSSLVISALTSASYWRSNAQLSGRFESWRDGRKETRSVTDRILDACVSALRAARRKGRRAVAKTVALLCS